jgi:hypothetical protein
VKEMRVIYLIFIISAILIASIVHAHIIYKWVDKDGIENYTDDYSKIPISYRDRVNILYIHEEAVSPPVQKIAPQKREDSGKDIYGRDERWWREKARLLKERLKEAEERYEKAHEKFMQKAMELGRRRFGSPTQYKSIIKELDSFKEEIIKYQAQIALVHDEWSKLYKEAEESKANPDWLK